MHYYKIIGTKHLLYDKIVKNIQIMNCFFMEYYEKMKVIREDKDLKQINVANMLNIKQQQYSEYEMRKRLIPITILKHFCVKMNVSADYILE